METLIDQYVAGGSELRRAYTGLTREQLFAQPIPNTWSLQQIAVHMMDSDLIGSDRMKRIACMDRPLLIGYDESAFSTLPGSHLIQADQAIDLFDRNRQLTACVLRQLPIESFQRWGVHNEKGKITLQECLQGYIAHLSGHLQWVKKKRELLGVPLK